ncbi:hypothetical protein [Breoghania sp.]|uniref:hypothetical protein n=1 Tax=Breoghania sp. TaxID=2065378 RepID=UPI00260E8970|nr:hypothetical protein [Breoghania sp.]MDJ0933165.1 hypothetical protein [Breoghania sp.]
MTKIYNSVEMQESRRHILGIREAHKSLIKDDKTNGNISQYAQRIILELLDKHIASVKEDPSAETKYKKSISLLDFIEDIGVLSSKGYIRKKIFLDLWEI